MTSLCSICERNADLIKGVRLSEPKVSYVLLADKGASCKWTGLPFTEPERVSRLTVSGVWREEGKEEGKGLGYLVMGGLVRLKPSNLE